MITLFFHFFAPRRYVLYIYIYIIVKQSKKKIQRLGGTLLLLWYMDMMSVTIFLYYGGGYIQRLIYLLPRYIMLLFQSLRTCGRSVLHLHLLFVCSYRCIDYYNSDF